MTIGRIDSTICKLSISVAKAMLVGQFTGTIYLNFTQVGKEPIPGKHVPLAGSSSAVAFQKARHPFSPQILWISHHRSGLLFLGCPTGLKSASFLCFQRVVFTKLSTLEYTFIRRRIDELDPSKLRILTVNERCHKVNVPNGANNKNLYLLSMVTYEQQKRFRSKPEFDSPHPHSSETRERTTKRTLVQLPGDGCDKGIVLLLRGIDVALADGRLILDRADSFIKRINLALLIRYGRIRRRAHPKRVQRLP